MAGLRHLWRAPCLAEMRALARLTLWRGVAGGLALLGLGFFLAAALAGLICLIGLIRALLAVGFALWLSAGLILLLHPSRPPPPAPDPRARLVFDLAFLAARAWPRRRR